MEFDSEESNEERDDLPTTSAMHIPASETHNHEGAQVVSVDVQELNENLDNSDLPTEWWEHAEVMPLDNLMTEICTETVHPQDQLIPIEPVRRQAHTSNDETSRNALQDTNVGLLNINLPLINQEEDRPSSEEEDYCQSDVQSDDDSDVSVADSSKLYCSDDDKSSVSERASVAWNNDYPESSPSSLGEAIAALDNRLNFRANLPAFQEAVLSGDPFDPINPSNSIRRQSQPSLLQSCGTGQPSQDSPDSQSCVIVGEYRSSTGSEESLPNSGSPSNSPSDSPPDSPPSSNQINVQKLPSSHLQLNESAAPNKNIQADPNDTSQPGSSSSSSPVQRIINPTVKQKLDGLMVVGESWNIVTIDGTISFFTPMRVKSEPAMHYKGIPHAMKAKHRYEIPFASVDNCLLSLLITSDSQRNTTAGKGKHLVNYADMCMRFSQIVKDAMKEAGGKSWNSQLLTGNAGISIREENWLQIGNIVASQLRSHCVQIDYKDGEDDELDNRLEEEETMEKPKYSCKAPKQVFPIGAKFCFILKKFGHDKDFLKALKPNPYPHVSVNRKFTTRVIIHVAHDYTLSQDLLFFSKTNWKHVYQTLGVLPTHQYNLGLLPHINNYVYMKLPSNRHNVAAMQLYTRLFHQIHRNSKDFFKKSVIAKSMVKAYISKLNHTDAWKREGPINAIKAGALQNMRDGILNIITNSDPINARCEFVWSYELANTEDSENLNEQGDNEEEPFYTSITDLMQKAFSECENFKQRYDICPVEKFTVKDRTEVMFYIRSVIGTLLNTLTGSLALLDKFLDIQNGSKIYEAAYTFKIEDFADFLVAEAMTTRMLRGEMSAFPKLLEKYVFIKKDVIEVDTQDTRHQRLLGERAEDEELQNIDLYNFWPFNSEIIWKTERQLVRTSIPITRLFADFSQILGGAEQGQHMVDLTISYRKWKKTQKDETKKSELVTYNLFIRLCYAILQRLMIINKQKGDNYNALRTLYDEAKFEGKKPVVPVYSSLRLYKTVTEETSQYIYAKMAPIKFFLTYLKDMITDKQSGGTQWSISLAMDCIMWEQTMPFLYRLPNRATIPIFVPVTFIKPQPAYVSIYSRAFYAVYRKRHGKRSIHIENFMIALVKLISHLPLNERPEDFTNIFFFIHKLLDSNSLTRHKIFSVIPQIYKDALLPVTKGNICIPDKEAPKQKSIHPELFIPDDHDKTKPFTRAAQKKLDEKKRLEAEKAKEKQRLIDVASAQKLIEELLQQSHLQQEEVDNQLPALVNEENVLTQSRLEGILKDDNGTVSPNDDDAGESTSDVIEPGLQTTRTRKKRRIITSDVECDKNSSLGSNAGSTINKAFQWDEYDADVDEEEHLGVAPKSTSQKTPQTAFKRNRSRAITFEELHSDVTPEKIESSNSTGLPTPYYHFSNPIRRNLFNSGSSPFTPKAAHPFLASSCLFSPSTQSLPKHNHPSSDASSRIVSSNASSINEAVYLQPDNFSEVSCSPPTASIQNLRVDCMSESNNTYSETNQTRFSFDRGNDDDVSHLSDCDRFSVITEISTNQSIGSSSSCPSAASPLSTVSTGVHLRKNIRKNTETPFSTLRLAQATFTKYTPTASNKKSKSKANQTTRLTSGRTRMPNYTEEETRALFTYLSRHKLLKYMKGFKVAKILATRQVGEVFAFKRPFKSIQTHIKEALKSDRLQFILNVNLFKEVQEAKEWIETTKHTNNLPNEYILKVFDIDLDSLEVL